MRLPLRTMIDTSRLNDRTAYLLALGFKLVMLVPMLAGQERWPFGDRPFAIAIGDTRTYFEPIDNLLEHGAYTPDLRMPGYGAVYLLPRLVAGPPVAMGIVIVLQILLAAGCTVALMRCALLLGAGPRTASVVFLIAALGLWTNTFDVLLLTESFCVSAVVFSLLFYLRAWRQGGRRALLVSGAFMAWAVFLKLICVNFLALMIAGSLLRRGTPLRQRAVQAALFLLPFLAADLPWTLRNAFVNGRFAPLSNGWFLNEDTDVYPHLSRMIMAMGGSVVFWSGPDADIRWFNVGATAGIDGQPQANTRPASIPAWWASGGCDMDTLRLLARVNLRRQDTTRTTADRDRDKREVMRLCAVCRGAFQRERIFHHQVTARLRCLKLFVLNPGVPYPFQATFDRMPWHFKAFKLAHMALYALVLSLATVFSLMVLGRNSEGSHRLLATLFVSGVLVIPFVSRLTENRYMAPVWPFALLCAALLAERLFTLRRTTARP